MISRKRSGEGVRMRFALGRSLMKTKYALLASLLFVASGCDDTIADTEHADAAPGDAAQGNDGGGSADGGLDAEFTDARVADAPTDSPVFQDAAPADITPMLLAAGSVTLAGITSDGYVIYRTAAGVLSAVLDQPGSTPTVISAQTGSTSAAIRGKVIFAFSNVNYTTNVGDLTVWTASTGPRFVGPALINDDSLSATVDGSSLLYAANVNPVKEDIVLAASDLSSMQTLVGGAGRGSLTTCAPSFGFGGAHAFVASCALGSMAATLTRFDRGTGGSVDAGADGGDAGTSWGAVPIATNVQPIWSADAAGQRVLYVTNSGEGRYAEGAATYHFDSSVTGGTFLADGSVILYTVADQLRRVTISAINPIPIVTNGYARTAWSPDYSFVLYSTQIVYPAAGERRDLRIASTASLNVTPDVLLAQPNGNVTRSAFTADSKFVLYQTDLAAGVGTLDVRASSGGAVRTIPTVVSALAASASKIVFADARSDTSLYPITASVSVLDLAGTSAPQVLQTKVLDSGSFYVTPSGDHVVYVRSGVAADAGAGQEGLYIQAIP